jgi:hypothetical protein
MIVAIVCDHIARQTYCRIENAVGAFNERFLEPMTHTNAIAALAQPLRTGRIRRVAKHVYMGPPADGPLLPVLRAVSPAAYDVYRVLDPAYPSPTPTRSIIRLAREQYGRILTRDHLYKALHLLEQQGVLSWDYAWARLNKLHLTHSQLLGGFATDVRTGYDAKAPFNDALVDAHLAQYRTRRDENDDEIGLEPDQIRDPTELLLPPAINPFS